MNERLTYEEKQEAKKERLQARAGRLRTQSDSLFTEGKEALAAIPLGQPILVDHYSANRDRRYRARAAGKIDKSFELSNQADEVERRAEAVGTGGISSDDERAIEKLEEKLDKQVEAHEEAKAANAEAKLNGHEKPYPTWALTNSNARIRATKQRIEQLKARANREGFSLKTDAFEVRTSEEENRIQFIFPGKPEEHVRKILKSRGFKWSPRQEAWVRLWNQNGIFAAKCVIKELTN